MIRLLPLSLFSSISYHTGLFLSSNLTGALLPPALPVLSPPDLLSHLLVKSCSFLGPQLNHHFLGELFPHPLVGSDLPVNNFS